MLFPSSQPQAMKRLRRTTGNACIPLLIKMLQYWVILPNRVKPAELTPQHLPEVGLTNLGRYATDDAQPYMEVWAAYERCQWEMNPSDWLFNKLELMGEKVLNQRLIAHPSGSGLLQMC